MFVVQGWRAVHEKDVREGWGSEVEEVMGVCMDIGRKRWRGSERVLGAWRGTRRVLALNALSVLGLAASVSCVPRQGKGWRTQSDLGSAKSL